MNAINRAAIIVVPKQPFFTWAAGLDDPLDEMPNPDALASVFLVEFDDENFQPAELVRRHFGVIFDQKLEAWHTVVDDWPPRRTFALFHEWFDVQVLEPVLDLSEDPIEQEPW
jgi:hypothetical protein